MRDNADGVGAAIGEKSMRMERVALTPKKNTVLFSLESKRAGFFETFGGPYPSPNMSRLAAKGVQFNNMIASAPSTAMSLTSVLEGKFSYELEQGDYGTSGAKSPLNLFALEKQDGKRNYFVWAEHLFPTYKPKIYDGPDTEFIGIPLDEWRSTNVALKVVELANASEQPCFIFAHNGPERPCAESEKPKWRNKFERYVYEDDLAIGILLDNLDFENTRLIVYGDHGMLTGEHGNLYWYAFSLYQQCIHVPCLISDDTALVTNEPHSLIELYDVVRKNEIVQEPEIVSDTMFSLQRHRITSLRRGHWKYVAHYSWETALAGKQEELYDLSSDPGEHRNLLHDIARNPLRVEWNSDDVGATWDCFSYNSDELESVLVSMRSRVAKIWVEGFTERLMEISPQSAERAKELLTDKLPRYQMYIVGELVARLCGDTTIYEDWKKDRGLFPGLPVVHPMHPESKEQTFDLPIYQSGVAIGR